MFQVGYGVKWTEEQNVLRGKVCWAANCAEEQGVMRSNGCWEANCAEEKRVLGSKGGWGVKCSKKKNIPVGKVCWGVKCVKKQTVTSQFEANCSFEQKITMQRVPKQENVLRSKVCLSHVFVKRCRHTNQDLPSENKGKWAQAETTSKSD